jgi:hypothetical protein
MSVEGTLVERPRRRPISLTPFVFVAVVVFCGYKAFTWMNEYTMMTTAKASCVEFAKEREVFPAGQKVIAMDAWTKHDGRYAVVALGNPGYKPFQKQLCVNSKYMVSIASRIEEAFWY